MWDRQIRKGPLWRPDVRLIQCELAVLLGQMTRTGLLPVGAWSGPKLAHAGIHSRRIPVRLIDFKARMCVLGLVVKTTNWLTTCLSIAELVLYWYFLLKQNLTSCLLFIHFH